MNIVQIPPNLEVVVDRDGTAVRVRIECHEAPAAASLVAQMLNAATTGDLAILLAGRDGTVQRDPAPTDAQEEQPSEMTPEALQLYNQTSMLCAGWLVDDALNALTAMLGVTVAGVHTDMAETGALLHRIAARIAQVTTLNIPNAAAMRARQVHGVGHG